MTVSGAGGKRDVGVKQQAGLGTSLPLKKKELPPAAIVRSPPGAATKFDAQGAPEQKVTLEGRTPQREFVGQTGSLGFEIVDEQRKPVKRTQGSMASVGLDCSELYQPGDKLPVLPNLSNRLRRLELEVNSEFEANPQEFVDRYRSMVDAEGGVPTFVVDDAKGALRPDEWLGAQGLTHEVKHFRSSGPNAAMHQAAHATAQMAFVQMMDELAELPPGDPKRNVLVTNGGCGAGKGYALKQGLSADFKNKFGAIWDAAGEQAGLDNQWILEAAAKRGIKVTMVYVNADPIKAFERAVTKRYDEEGRLVNVRSFAESYVDGGNNMRTLIGGFDRLPGEVELVVVDNTGEKPTARTFDKTNIKEAQADLRSVIHAGWESLEALQTQLRKAVPEHLPTHAWHGLSVLDTGPAAPG